jgi:hypothetical protein
MNRKMIIAVGVSILFTSIILIWLQRPTFRVIKSWKQSADISYSSFDPYFLNIVEDNIDLGHLPFTAPRNYFLYIGKENDEVTYGHIKNYSFEYNDNIDEYLNGCEVEWTSKGVTFKESSGHSLFIPKKAFIGGR